jgi:hypothetical protein
MSVDQSLLEILTDYSNKNSLDCYLYLEEKTFQISNASIVHLPTPVNEPTTRGGVYFSEKFAYKMKGEIKDLSIIPLLTNKMLGPNTEFGELKIIAKLELKDKIISVEIFTNLTNSVQTPNSIELSMIIVKLNRA